MYVKYIKSQFCSSQLVVQISLCPIVYFLRKSFRTGEIAKFFLVMDGWCRMLPPITSCGTVNLISRRLNNGRILAKSGDCIVG